MTARPPADPAAALYRDRLWRLGELAATLAHDLGQPLNIMRLTAEIAVDALDDGRVDPVRLRRALGTVMDQSLRAQAMIDAVIACTRRPSAPPVRLSPVEATRRALSRHLAKMRAQGIRLRWHARPDCPPVRGHAARLEAAVWHLVVNACEAVGAGRLAGTGAGTVRVEFRPDGDNVAIAIADDGPGFPPTLRAALAAATPDGGDGGLGLTLAQGIAAEMNGDLSIADEAGCGTRVTLRLPAAVPTLFVAGGWPCAEPPPRRWRLTTRRDIPADAALVTAACGGETPMTAACGGGPDMRLVSELRAAAADLAIIVLVPDDGGDAIRRAVTLGATMAMPWPATVRSLSDALAEATGETW